MNKIKLLAIAFAFSAIPSLVMAQNDRNDLYNVANIKRYAEVNKQLPAKQKNEKRVVFIGNSITDQWYKAHPDWFKSNNYFGRGIGGQTSPQMLLRFQADVIDLQADVVVINAGTNDIAENTGKYNFSYTLGCIKSMAEVARANGIKVILTSVLPHDRFSWRPEVGNPVNKIEELNKAIKAYADANKIPYVDYNKEMRKPDGGMKDELSKDGVHPYPDSYFIMEALVKPVIDKQLKKK